VGIAAVDDATLHVHNEVSSQIAARRILESLLHCDAGSSLLRLDAKLAVAKAIRKMGGGSEAG